ncbi:L,D-transpeptidase family protein [Profundibacterium mesophilum]|uniref:L,D-TPase catalytic domain-containing protein n=1 Tax=Profundibacterium mesophilum KAUST100406-0324 TaxID=1037889 RepID=A0A921TC15_9RHOB|nr:L,D-transpeptidase family protein [Profundibacterium mesophilum]KAF0676530.1 uncharacterized protein PMES_01262 [Profundibacterium mesophilum KAUST100406-0324]
MIRPVLELDASGLRVLGRRVPCSIGRGGVVAASNKAEGDGATPAGSHRIAGLLYRADRMAAPAPWARAIGPRDLWSDAPGDPAYNSMVTAPYAPSHERLRRADGLYDIVMVVDWNMDPAIPGAGSAIFVHAWRRPGYPTEGCIAVAPAMLRRMVPLCPPGTLLRVRG